MARIADLIEELGLSGQVMFVPPQQHHILSTYYRAADVVLVPSRSESFGLVALEAGACGVPVVAYRRGGPGELVQTGVNGVLVAPDDVDALATAVQTAAGIDRRDCRQWVEANASREALAERLETWLLAGLAAPRR